MYYCIIVSVDERLKLSFLFGFIVINIIINDVVIN